MGEGESIEYLAEEKASDPKVMGIVANGYPTRGLSELGLENKYQAYYATKMALWCYIISGWDINSLKVNPGLTGTELARAQNILAAAKDIYVRGTSWNEILSPEVTCTPDRDAAYPVTIGGKSYKQQVFTFWSKTWVCDYTVGLTFTDPDAVPAGTRLVDMGNRDITAITTSSVRDGFAGQFKVLYPAEAVAGENGSVQLSFSTNVYRYGVYYAVCAEKGKYGELQNYMVDTDPTSTMRLSAYSNYAETTIDTPDTSLKILKLETGSEVPLSGALFEVIDPDGATVGTFTTNSDGEIMLPLTLSGNYTVMEKAPSANHLLGTNTTQNVKVEYGKVATVTFYNAPYGTLTVEKLSNTGISLPGAVITIRHIESGKTYTATTNYSGRAIFTKIQPGAYRVQETAAPSGWKLDDTVYTATVVSGETTTVPIVNEELPGLRIIKYDRKTHEAMAGVTFEIFRDTVSLGKFRTDVFGEILLTNAAPGTYLAREVDTGSDGHILDTTPQQVELTAGDGIKELLFFNDVKPGLHLVKVDSADPSKVIPNAVFEIKSVAGDYGPKEFITDEYGEIDLSKLPVGVYVVTEKSCPGYVIDQAQRIIQLDPNEDAQFVFTNSIKPSLQLIKTSADGSRLPGVTFRIARIADGSHYLDRTTNAQGEILIADLEPGVYSVKEMVTVTDHLIDPQEYHVELFPGQTSTIVLQNDKRPNLIIHKNDADTGEPVAGAVFTVKAADGGTVTEVKTGADGTATVENLLPIVYEVTEKSVPSPYLLDAPSQLITLHPNRDSRIYFENHKKPSLTVNKVDSITGDPIQGAKFQVWYGSNNTDTGELNDLGVYYSDKNGQVTLNEVKHGWYKVTELEPATGYANQDPATQECFVEAGKGKVLTFENTPLSALVVFKYDSVTGEAVEGAVFQIKYLGGTSGTGGTVIGTYKTSANGSFTVTALSAGTYICEELASDSGHVIDTAPQTAYISGKEQDVVQLYFGNSPKGSLLIKKIDSATHAPLSDVEFMVTTSDGTVVGSANGKFTTDSAGSILISNLNPGESVVVKETRAKDGYLLDDVPQTAKIIAGETETLEFRNQPKGNLVINKLDSVTKKPLSGVTFKITCADGSFVPDSNGKLSSNGLYYTDKNGQIILSGITGTLVVTEEKTIDGYTIDEDTRTQTVVVNPNDTQTLTFYNARSGGLELIKVNEADRAERIPNVTFEIRKMDGGLVDTVTTDKRGRVFVSLTSGDYYAVEVKAAEGYLLDDTPHYFTVRDGRTTTLTVTNKAFSGILLHKIDSATRKGIHGVTFLLYDGKMNPVEQLDATERLRVLHDFYRTGEETQFRFDLRESMKKGHSFKDAICPDSMEFQKDHFVMGNKYGRVLFLKEYASYIKDSMVNELTALNRTLMLSIDVIPVPTDEAVREIQSRLLGVETNVTNWQRRQNSNNNYSAVVPYDLEQQRKETCEMLDDLTTRDQRMMFAVVTLVHLADSKEELDSDTETLQSIARKHLCQLSPLNWQQADGLVTALPLGLRRIDALRTLTTEALAVLMPFKAQEIRDRGGVYYGQNAISKNLIIADRKRLLNGNGFVLGVSGSGKSFTAKEEIAALAMDTDDDIICIDPEAEYRPLIEGLGGEVIDISATSPNHINALDMEQGYGDGDNPVVLKSEFLLSLCEQLMGEGKLSAKEKSIIDRCTAQVYRGYIRDGYQGSVPTLQDFHAELLRQPERSAHDVALAIELFTEGSLNTFAKPTNVDTNARILCYDIRDLGKQLLPVGMLVVLDSIFNRIIRNRKAGKNTWIYIDEIYLLFQHEYSANFLFTLWKRVRKYGACATGLTQNVDDLLQSHTARTMLANSEFLVMLNQASTDRAELTGLLNISDNQLSYITNVDSGRGLIKCGSAIVPFMNSFPKYTKLYQLMTTKPSELAA